MTLGNGSLPKLGGRTRDEHEADPRHARILKLADFRATPTPISFAAAVDLTDNLPPDTDDLGNVDVGDCGVAGPGHQIAWMDTRTERSQRVTADGVLADYYAITGGPDVGVQAADVFDYWTKTGICGCKIGAHLAIDLANDQDLSAAMFELGGVHLLLQLPKCVQGADKWDVPSGDDGGVWGGHWVWAHAKSGLWIVNSWGQHIPVTPAFIARYAYAAYAALTNDMLDDATGLSFAGLDLPGLNAALEAL